MAKKITEENQHLIDAVFNGNIKHFKKARAVFHQIKYRCGKTKGYENVEFELESFPVFCEWLRIMGGYREGWHCARLCDSGNYEYSNIIYVPPKENARQRSRYYLITDLITQKQILAQARLTDILLREFNITSPCPYGYVNNNKLYNSRYVIKTISA